MDNKPDTKPDALPFPRFSAEDIDRMRKEMWTHFPDDDVIGPVKRPASRPRSVQESADVER